MILIVASVIDTASVNIAHKLIGNFSFAKTMTSFQQNPVYEKKIQEEEAKLVFVNQETIWAQYVTDHFTPRLVIFVSRHSGAAGIPTLSVHTPGNLSEETKFGGLPRKISVSPASAMKNALLEMARLKNEKSLTYDVSYECTHHGPSLNVPTMFVELGSSPTQWKDLKAAEIVASAAMSAIINTSGYPTVLGVGGTHYNRKFTEIALSTSKAFGHMIPKYATSGVDDEMAKQCVQRVVGKVEAAVFDWKGIRGADRDRISHTLKELAVPIEKA